MYIHLSYFLIAQTALDTFTTQNIYRYLIHQEDPHVPNIVRHFPRFNWSLIFHNLRSVRQYDLGYDLWFRIVHNVFPTNARLHELDIIPHDQCNKCHLTDDLSHRFTACPPIQIIWRQYQRMVAILLHTSSAHVHFNDMIRFPEYRYYPPHKKKKSPMAYLTDA